MCFKIESPVMKIAKRDIPVRKLAIQYPNGLLRTYYMEVPIQPGKMLKYFDDVGNPHIWTIKPGTSVYKSFPRLKGYGYINGNAIHSYSKNVTIFHPTLGVILKAYIPKGTKYMYSSKHGEYISEQIFVEPIISKNEEKYA